MLFQASKVVWSLLLLNVGLCLALRRIISAPPNEAGERIISASCRGNLYTSMAVHNAIQNRLRAMYEQGQISGELTQYHPKPNENLRIEGPFFSTYIGDDKTDNQRDLVVFTGKGKLVKVIAQVRDESSIPSPKGKQWRFEDCRLRPELITSPMTSYGYLQ